MSVGSTTQDAIGSPSSSSPTSHLLQSADDAIALRAVFHVFDGHNDVAARVAADGQLCVGRASKRSVASGAIARRCHSGER